jgi:aryl-alcohol dehydrogenase-like predicted oxidoreductase
MTQHQLLLGTAQWGWTTPEIKAFELLDAFYESGFRQIDSATNYPINKQILDFRHAEKIISHWIRANGVTDLKIMMKIGSLNNLRTPECNLNPSFLLMSLEQYQRLFGSNLETLMLHWDNRDDEKEINKTLETLQHITTQGFKIGLSGIKYPEIYATQNDDFKLHFSIQIKHNLLQSDYEKYQLFHQKADFIAYGINAGGVKLDAAVYNEKSVLAARGGDLNNENELLRALPSILAIANENKNRPSINSFFQVGMLYAFSNPDIKSMICAPSNTIQWKSTLSFLEHIQQYDYQDIINEIMKNK